MNNITTFKTDKCKKCNKTYSIVNWVRGRKDSFCSYDHAKQYVLNGFNQLTRER